MITEEQQVKIDEVLDWFDFQRVLKVMDALDWAWCGEVPDHEGYLREKARRLLKDSIYWGEIASGGFSADYEDGEFTLRFVVSKWSSF